MIDEIIRDVAELPDRTSPEDQLDMMLVTADDLRTIIRSHLKPHDAVSEKRALVIYFDNDEDRIGMVEAFKEVCPTARAVLSASGFSAKPITMRSPAAASVFKAPTYGDRALRASHKPRRMYHA